MRKLPCDLLQRVLINRYFIQIKALRQKERLCFPGYQESLDSIINWLYNAAPKTTSRQSVDIRKMASHRIALHRKYQTPHARIVVKKPPKRLMLRVIDFNFQLQLQRNVFKKRRQWSAPNSGRGWFSRGPEHAVPSSLWASCSQVPVVWTVGVKRLEMTKDIMWVGIIVGQSAPSTEYRHLFCFEGPDEKGCWKLSRRNTSQ